MSEKNKPELSLHSCMGLALLALPFAYDTGAFDVVNTKHFAWTVGLAALSTLALLQEQLKKRILWSLCLVGLCFLPTWLRGVPLLLWWVPWTQALGMVFWWNLVLAALPSPTPESPLQHKAPKVLLGAITVSLLGMSLWVFLQRWAPECIPFATTSSKLADGLFGNPNHLGAFLSVGIPACLVLHKRSLALLFLLLPVLLLTGSRLSLLSCGLALTIGGFLLCYKRKWWEGGGALVATLATVVLSFSFSPHKNLHNLTSGWGGLSARTHLVQCAAPMLRKEGLLGTGWGRFRQVFPAYRGRCIQGTQYQNDPQHTVVMNLHNDWMEVVLEGGIVGWLLWLFVLFIGLRHIRKAQTLLWRERVWLSMVLVAMAIQMAGHFPLQLSPVVAIVLTCWAILAWASQHSMPNWWQQKTSQPISQKMRFLLLWGWFLILVVQWHSYKAERLFAKADIALENGSPKAMKLLLQSEAYFPSVRTSFQKAQILLDEKKPKQSIRELKKAMRWMPDAQVAQYMAMAYMQMKQRSKALHMIQQGLQLRPGFPPLLQLRSKLLTKQNVSQRKP